MNIRRAIVEDIRLMLSLEHECASAAHWSEQQYKELFAPGAATKSVVLIAERTDVAAMLSQPTLLGFLVAREVASEWELENLVVAAPVRRKGIGGRLINALFMRVEESGGTLVFLEVRESNLPARKLYEKAGFQQTGRRKSYYANPAEDALTYRKGLQK